MPFRFKFPGIYVEQRALLRTIQGVETGVAAFVGFTAQGPDHRPVRVRSFADFEQTFGGLTNESELSYAVSHFFTNGGIQAWVVRVPGPYVADLVGTRSAPSPTGLYALDGVDLFNLLVLPDATRARPGVSAATLRADALTVYRAALAYAKERRAMLLVDPMAGVQTAADAATWVRQDLAPLHDANAAAYFPRVWLADPLNGGAPRAFALSGVIAGLIARTDATRGVWKAPAGREAVLQGVQRLDCALTDADQSLLNPLGLNCTRTFPGIGHVAWGARTLAGADAMGSEWKYLPVRRLALFIEESVQRGTAWVVSEPNGEPLWSQVRTSITTFLLSLWKAGALVGMKAEEGFFVKCDRSTMTAADIAAGRVVTLIGIAPLKPAEFVIVRITQTARSA